MTNIDPRPGASSLPGSETSSPIAGGDGLTGRARARSRSACATGSAAPARGRRTARRCLLCLATLILLAAASARASTYLDVSDEAYALLSRLEAEGLISDSILSTRPLSRKEIVRLALVAEANVAGRSDFIKSLVQELKRRVQASDYTAGAIKPVESVYARYIYTSADVSSLSYPGAVREKEQAFNYNNDGDLYGRGSNYRFGLTSRLEELGPLSIFVNPEYRSANDAEQGVLKAGYAVIGFSWIDIVVGKDSQWWGPGYHGTFLLSNNAEPLTMIKFTGPAPQTLPWILKYLGPFQYNVFVSQLEKDRSDYSRPYFWGARVAFKPHPNIEIGLARTAILGGRGRPTDAATWLHSMIGSNEHDPVGNPGDQLAGYDVTLTLPFRLQPVQIYWEQAGEENRQRNSRRPYKLANLFGIYLPRVLGFEPLDLRAEYARNDVNKQAYVWYTHGVYTAGYTYRGMIMGHHMGTESRDLFLELSWLLPDKGARISLVYDRETHDQDGPFSETVSESSIRGIGLVSKQLEISASFGYGRIENSGNASGQTRNVNAFSSVIRYLF